MKKEISKVNKFSGDLLADKIAELKRIIPEVFSEDKIDWEKLKMTLDGEIDNRSEKYGLSWAGKSEAFRAIRIPATGTLVPQEKESKDIDKTQNIFIEGDNLEALKLLQKHYREQIKMIYIDPPYNTGKDFIYKDNFTEGLSDYYERTGQAKDGVKMTSNLESNGRYHSDWLTMMYPRLFMARNLLREDGVIFISIDDNEVHNLRMIMDEIFGEENFVANIIWEKKYAPQNDAKWLSDNHDYVLLYAKNKEHWRPKLLPRTEEADARYENPDNDVRGVWKATDFSRKALEKNTIYQITLPSGKKVLPPRGRSWLHSKEKLEVLIKDNRIWFGQKGDNVPSLKRFLNEVKEGMTSLTIWKRGEVGDTQEGRQIIREIFGDTSIFDTPKSIRLIKKMLLLATVQGKNDIILDFFAGSGTTAHAVMDLNAEDGGNRKWICVQIPEEVDEKSEAKKADFNTIAEIARERIRRAAAVIARNQQTTKQSRGIATLPLKGRDPSTSLRSAQDDKLDLGFKSFKLTKSNYRQWNVITDKDDEKKLKAQMKLFVEKPLVDDYDEKSVVYEVLVKEGFDLNAKVEQVKIGKLEVWTIADGERKAVISFAKKLIKDQVDSLSLSENDTFVCLDSALDDTTKVNLIRNYNIKVI